MTIPCAGSFKAIEGTRHPEPVEGRGTLSLSKGAPVEGRGTLSLSKGAPVEGRGTLSLSKGAPVALRHP